MDELVTLVANKTGLSEAHAKLAVDTVLGFLKTKLPAPLAAQIDGLVSGSTSGGDLLGQVGDLAKGGLGGLFK